MTQSNKKTSDILELIRQERKRLIKKGFTKSHNNEEIHEALISAESVYVVQKSFSEHRLLDYTDFYEGCGERYSRLNNHPWPYKEEFKSSSNRKKDLIKAAALMVAEIERLDRIKNK